MYHDYNGGEVEDAEMDAMHEDAREGTPSNLDILEETLDTDIVPRVHLSILKERMKIWQLRARMEQLRLLERIAYELGVRNLIASGEIDRVPDDIAYKVPFIPPVPMPEKPSFYVELEEDDCVLTAEVIDKAERLAYPVQFETKDDPFLPPTPWVQEDE